MGQTAPQMFASKHAVFAGPGRLPKELRDLLLRRQGAPQSDLAVQPARLLSFFETAADAERVASQLQRLKIAAVVAGPEQPPAEQGWLEVEAIEFEGDSVRAHAPNAELRTFTGAEVKAITVVDWRLADGSADRDVLVRLRDFHRPVHLSASHLKNLNTHEGLRIVAGLTERVFRGLTDDAEVRQRRLTPEAVGAPTLIGPLFALGLAFVDAVEPPGAHPVMPETPASLQRAKPAALQRASPIQDTLGTVWRSAAVLSAPLTIFLLSKSLWPALVVGLWGTRRFFWAKWLRGGATRAAAVGSEPAWWDPLLELGLTGLWFTLAGNPLLRPIALPLTGVFAFLSAASVLTVIAKEPKDGTP